MKHGYLWWKHDACWHLACAVWKTLRGLSIVDGEFRRCCHCGRLEERDHFRTVEGHGPHVRERNAEKTWKLANAEKTWKLASDMFE